MSDENQRSDTPSPIRGKPRRVVVIRVAVVLLGIAACVVLIIVPEIESPDGSGSTQFETRAARRAYDGAPPVIPHVPFGAACTSCHTATGMKVPDKGLAPANPHLGTLLVGRTTNCRQCHLFAKSEELFAETTFEGLQQMFRGGERMYDGAPPVIPHTTLTRENCQACHSGPSARPEIRCTHPHRTNCVQCHVQRQTVDSDWLGESDQ